MYKLLQVSQKNDLIYRELRAKNEPDKKTIWFKNGFLYKGMTQNNFLHGQGLLLLGDGTYYQGNIFIKITYQRHF